MGVVRLLIALLEQVGKDRIRNHLIDKLGIPEIIGSEVACTFELKSPPDPFVHRLELFTVADVCVELFLLFRQG